MKQRIHFSAPGIFAFIFLLSAVVVQEVRSQDYLDVPQGYETLNLIVEGDSLANGTRNPNRVYRLENNGFYLINGALENSMNGGFPLHIEAADPFGMPPVLVPATDESGSSTNIFDFVADGSVKGLYLSSLDQTANYIRNNLSLRQDSIKVVIDRCYFDYDRQAPLRCDAFEQKLFVYNTIIRNCSRMGTQSTGRVIDCRENLVDSLIVQNCTFYFSTGEIINDQGGALIRNLLFDHNTMVGVDKIDSYSIVRGKITNNIFSDVGWESQNIHFDEDEIAEGDTLREEILPLDSLRSPLFTEAERQIFISHNNFTHSPQMDEWINSQDSIVHYLVHNSYSQRFIDENPNITSENWINEYPEFSDPPDFGLLAVWAEYDHGPGPEEGTPDIIADRHPNDENDILSTFGVTDVFYGLTQDEFKFDYPSSKVSYILAQGGFPLGDLNWFPDKKAEWETWYTGVEEKAPGIPDGYCLAQNYPNPFNPVTTINYSVLKSSSVSLVVYNLMGQEVRTLVSEVKPAGSYRVRWDAKDNQGINVPGGIYLYTLKVGPETWTRKMVLAK